MKNADMPAMPIITPDMSVNGSGGLTKLEHFAGLAMQGLYACPEVNGSHEDLAKASVLAAKSLLAELEKEND